MVVSFIAGVLIGGLTLYLLIVAPADNTIRQLEDRIIDAQSTSRGIAVENQRLRNELERVEVAGRELDASNQRLTKRTIELANTNKRLTTGIERSLEEVRGINELGDDIAETVERIIGIVNELEGLFSEGGR